MHNNKKIDIMCGSIAASCMHIIIVIFFITNYFITNTCHKSRAIKRNDFHIVNLIVQVLAPTIKPLWYQSLLHPYLNPDQVNIKLDFRSWKSYSIIDIFEFCWCLKPGSRASSLSYSEHLNQRETTSSTIFIN